MSFKLRLKKKLQSRNTFFFPNAANDNNNEQENFLLEACKVPVSVDFRSAALNATKNLIKPETRNEKTNIIQNNISNLKLYSDTIKGFMRNKSLNKSGETNILPSILPEFKVNVNNQKNEMKKKFRNKNLSIHLSVKHEKKKSFYADNKKIVRQSFSPKKEDLFDFLNNNDKVLIKNEEKIGNLVRYSTIFQKNRPKFKKFYMD